MARIKEIKQGEVYWADLGSIHGHEQAGLRPVIVAQFNPLNRILSTVIIVPLTTNLKNTDLTLTQFIDKETSGLPKDSVALLHHVKSIDKSRLIKKAGEISKKDYFEIRFKLVQNIWCA